MFVVRLSDGENPITYRAFSNQREALKWGAFEVEHAIDVSSGDLFEVSEEVNATNAVEAVIAKKANYLEPIPPKPSVDRMERLKKREAGRFLARWNIVERHDAKGS